MTEVLSQAEIDSLLEALSTGAVQVQAKEEQQPKSTGCRRYDFLRPNKFSKYHLQLLQILHDNLSRLLSSFLMDYLHTNVYVRIASMEQFTFEEFVSSVPTPTLLTVFSLEPLLGMAIMETNPLFLFPILDIFFGGMGEMPKKIREFTELELSVIRKLNERILQNYAMAWRDLSEIKSNIESIESNPQLYQYISPGEIVAVVTLTTVIGANKGLINMCLPFVMIDPVISRLQEGHAHFGKLNTGVDQEEKNNLRFWLDRSELELSVRAGTAEISVQDFLDLQVGDVLALDRRVDQDMDVFVEKELKFRAQAGTYGGYRAVQITSLAEGGLDNV